MSQQPRIQNFQPSGNTVVITATTSSGTKALRTGTAQRQNSDILITNAGTANVFVTWGDSASNAIAVVPTAGASANGVLVLAGQTVAFYIGFAQYVDAITASGTATVYFTPGLGS